MIQVESGGAKIPAKCFVSNNTIHEITVIFVGLYLSNFHLENLKITASVVAMLDNIHAVVLNHWCTKLTAIHNHCMLTKCACTKLPSKICTIIVY